MTVAKNRVYSPCFLCKLSSFLLALAGVEVIRNEGYHIHILYRSIGRHALNLVPLASFAVPPPCLLLVGAWGARVVQQVQILAYPKRTWAIELSHWGTLFSYLPCVKVHDIYEEVLRADHISLK